MKKVFLSILLLAPSVALGDMSRQTAQILALQQHAEDIIMGAAIDAFDIIEINPEKVEQKLAALRAMAGDFSPEEKNTLYALCEKHCANPTTDAQRSARAFVQALKKGEDPIDAWAQELAASLKEDIPADMPQEIIAITERVVIPIVKMGVVSLMSRLDKAERLQDLIDSMKKK